MEERNIEETHGGEIPLKNRKHEITGWAKVSAEDFEDANSKNWNLSNYGYATKKSGSLHKYIVEKRMKLTIPKNYIIDHINVKNPNNKLDCRRENLRIITRGQNTHNKSVNSRRKRKNPDMPFIHEFRGVSYAQASKKWNASLTVNGVRYGLGWYNLIEDAAKAVDIFIIHNREKLKLMHVLNYPTFDYTGMIPYSKKQRNNTYKGVKMTRHGKFETKVGKIYIATFDTAIKAAEARDDYIVANLLKLQLAFPERHEDYVKNSVKITYRLLEDGKHIQLLSENINVNDSNVLVDIKDYDLIKYYSLSVSHDEEGRRRPRLLVSGKHVTLYRFILGLIGPEFEDIIVSHHPNPNPCDCRRINIHRSTHAINAQFRPKIGNNRYIGVSFDKFRVRFDARITRDKKHIFSLQGKDEEILARARDLFLLKHPNLIYPKNFNDWDDDLIGFWTFIVNDR